MKHVDNSEKLRQLPSVDRVLSEHRVLEVLSTMQRAIVVDATRLAIHQHRVRVIDGDDPPEIDELIDNVLRLARQTSMGNIRPAINASGIIIHTGLGRSLLCAEALQAVHEAAQSHCTLEIDGESGKRGSRQEAVRDMLCRLTNAQSAIAVNNNAAAVLLAVSSLAVGREVIISRGELVEIGGSFRLPEIIAQAGARLVEVGSTNRTRISDFQRAISSDTALILRCHPSNFKMIGFTEEPTLAELVELGSRFDIPVVDDLGSGALVELSQFGLADEPLVAESVSAGAALVTFSGDKLMGGPQAGLLVGNEDAVSKCASNPLARAVRIDKLTLAALEATLRIYAYGTPFVSVPTLMAISRTAVDVRAQASRLRNAISRLNVDGVSARLARTVSEIGGGSLPGQQMESWSIGLKSSRWSTENMGREFRSNNPPIFGRIADDELLLDMRTVSRNEEAEIVDCIRRLNMVV